MEYIEEELAKAGSKVSPMWSASTVILSKPWRR